MMKEWLVMGFCEDGDEPLVWGGGTGTLLLIVHCEDISYIIERYYVGFTPFTGYEGP